MKNISKILHIVVTAIWLTGCNTVWADEDKAMVDMIIQGDYVVTMADGQPPIEQGAVAVQDGVIVAVGPADKILGTYQAQTVLDGKGKAVMPGLINAHTHTAMTLFRGVADDYDLMTWLQKYIFPLEGQFVDPDFIETGSALACLEMIESGTTNFVDMYFYPDVIAGVIETCGLRATLGAPSIDFPSPGFDGWEDSFAAAKQFVATHQGKHPRIRPAFAPHAPYTVSPEHLKEVVAAANETGAPVTMHLAEDKSETDIITDRYGTTPVRHVKALGMLDVPLIAAHVVWPDTSEIAMMSKSPMGAIHNPTSNMKTAAGFSPVPDMLSAGVKVGLATDGAASNNNLDMWDEIKLAALIHKGYRADATVMPAGAVLRMATLGGAEAIHQADTVGSLEVGKQADLLQIDLGATTMIPLYDIVSHLVYTANARDVDTTIVAGTILMRDRIVRSLDADAVRRRAVEKGLEIKAALKDK